MYKLLYKVFDLLVFFGLWGYSFYIMWKPNPTIKDVSMLVAIILIIVLGNQSKIETLEEKIK